MNTALKAFAEERVWNLCHFWLAKLTFLLLWCLTRIALLGTLFAEKRAQIPVTLVDLTQSIFQSLFGSIIGILGSRHIVYRRTCAPIDSLTQHWLATCVTKVLCETLLWNVRIVNSGPRLSI